VASQYGTLQECITAIRQDLRTLPGLRPLLDEVPDAVNAYPAIVVYPIGMNWKLGSHSGDRGKGMRMGMYTIGIELIVARKDLARDVALLMEFCESLPDHLFAGFSRDKYGDTVLQLGNRVARAERDLADARRDGALVAGGTTDDAGVALSSST
jgi:hypothetical protein